MKNETARKPAKTDFNFKLISMSVEAWSEVSQQSTHLRG